MIIYACTPLNVNWDLRPVGVSRVTGSVDEGSTVVDGVDGGVDGDADWVGTSGVIGVVSCGVVVCFVGGGVVVNVADVVGGTGVDGVVVVVVVVVVVNDVVSFTGTGVVDDGWSDGRNVNGMVGTTTGAGVVGGRSVLRL